MVELFCEPVEVLFEVFEAVEHGAVRSEVVRVHNIAERDEVVDRDGGLVRRLPGGRIEVDDEYRAAQCGQELVQSPDIRRLAAAGRTDHDLAHRHRVLCPRCSQLDAQTGAIDGLDLPPKQSEGGWARAGGAS